MIRSKTSFLRSSTHNCISLHLCPNINLLIRLVARMGASHAPGRGSIPRWGISFCWLGQLCLRLPSFRSSAATEYTAAQTYLFFGYCRLVSHRIDLNFQKCPVDSRSCLQIDETYLIKFALGRKPPLCQMCVRLSRRENDESTGLSGGFPSTTCELGAFTGALLRWAQMVLYQSHGSRI
jgi:hypothetical protein